MISQKQAVTNVILSVFPDYEVNGEVILKSLLNTDIKKEMKATLFEAFRAGEVVYNGEAEKLADDVYLNKYVGSLLDNWVRKNPEFNDGFKSTGGKYVTKNPGSRAGSGDESIREMRKLLKTISDVDTKAEIEKAIADRIAVIKPETVVTINADAIPEHLKHLLG